MANESELKAERTRLQTVIGAIAQQLADTVSDNATVRQGIVEARRHLFETESHDVSQWDTVVELATYMQQEYAKESVYLGAKAREHRLRALLARPYFGSFDFREEGLAHSERLYIGIQSFMDDNGEELVCDWRAPISSLFYEDRLGRAGYESPAGLIEADILGKRQFIIRDGELVAMFDTELAIGDDVLREVMASGDGGRMHPIVATIQREQNIVIRDAEHRMLVVQGVAGSGKSSVAMQRVAYLLYKRRGHIRQDQIVVFAPNNLFSDYISRILPELGEEDVTCTTFPELARALLGPRLQAETLGHRMETLLQQGDPGPLAGRREIIAVKGAAKFADVIGGYVNHLNSGAMPFWDLVQDGEAVVAGETLRTVFASGRATLPLQARVEETRRALKELLAAHRHSRIRGITEELESHPRYMGTPDEIRRQATERADGEMAVLRRQAARLPCFNAAALYRRLYDNPELFAQLAEASGMDGDWAGICEWSAARLASGNWPHEDLAPAILLRMALSDNMIRSDIKYVIVDEAQDYSPCEWAVFRSLFPRARFTVVGDVNQALDGTYANLPDTLAAVFHSSGIHTTTLTRSYRQTRQLAAFCHALGAFDDKGDWLNREGALPQVMRLSDDTQLPAILAAEITRLLVAGARSLAVIGKTAYECQRLIDSSSGHFDAAYITEETGVYPAGVIVIPSYLAKGLEFDAVIIPDASVDSYPGEQDRRLLYTVCTRALHELCALYAGSLSPLIGQIDPELYVRT